MKFPQFWFDPVAKAFELVPFFTTGAEAEGAAVSVFFTLFSSEYPPKIEICVLPPGGA